MKEFDHDMINRYLDGEMGPDEIEAFESSMSGDAELQQEVELIKDLQATLKMKLHPGENEQALKNTLLEMNAEYFQEKAGQARIIPLKRRRWAVAVAAVFIMALVLTVWQPWEKEDLFTKYADIQMPGIAERGTPTDSLLKTATAHFNNKRFDQAIPVFETVLKDSGLNTFVQYYYAIALQQNGDTERSRNRFLELYNGSSSFKYEAAFYMALSYLKENNKAACREWLNKIPRDAGPYAKARELLGKL